MKKIALPLAFLAVLCLSGAAHAATSWNLLNEEEASFEAKVVDMICELTGDCPEECGTASDRQLGLLDNNGKLILVAKNLTFFAGGTMDLKPYCGETIEVDGFWVWADNAPRIYFLHALRRPGEEDWIKANAFTGEWVAREGFDPAGEERKKWWENDPRVLEVIEQDGTLGLGHEVDEQVFGTD